MLLPIRNKIPDNGDKLPNWEASKTFFYQLYLVIKRAEWRIFYAAKDFLDITNPTKKLEGCKRWYKLGTKVCYCWHVWRQRTVYLKGKLGYVYKLATGTRVLHLFQYNQKTAQKGYMKLKTLAISFTYLLYLNQSMILRKFVQSQTWTDNMFTVRGQTYDTKNCARIKCSGWNHTSELDSWKLLVLPTWSKKILQKRKFPETTRVFHVMQKDCWKQRNLHHAFLQIWHELGVCAHVSTNQRQDCSKLQARNFEKN